MNSTKVNFGVCGIGRFGTEHCRYFTRASEKYDLVALYDHNPERTRVVSEQYGGKIYADFAAFLADPDMELVIIATRSLDHASNAEQALAAGKTLLLEKPIAVTTADFELLKKLNETYPDKLYFCHNHRFEPAFGNARDIVAQELLGKVQVVKLCKHHEFMRRNDWQMLLRWGGGQLSVWGPHLIDQGLQLLGAPVREVSSYLRSILTPGDGDDHVKITLIGENDVAVEIEISNSVALPGAYCTIYGDRGTLRYGQDQQKIHLKYLDPGFLWPDAVANTGNPIGKPMSAEQDLPWIEEIRDVTPDTNMWSHVEIALVDHLYNALRNGIPFPIRNADALEVVRITGIVKQQNPRFTWLQ